MPSMRVSRLPYLMLGARGLAISADTYLIVPSRSGTKEVQDISLQAHEVEHCRQIAAAGGARRFWRRYVRFAQFRQDAEVAAFRVQLACWPPEYREVMRARYAQTLASWRYWLGITREEALELLAMEEQP